MIPLLFLSHAGADSAQALALADAIEASPEAQKAGLKVWLDQRLQGPNRLIGGTPWQEQLEAAIVQHSTAFGLLLTRKGAQNWVRLEVRVALDRVIAAQRAGGSYPFIPIIADDMKDVDALPPFARQYQGVRLTPDGGSLADLIRIAAQVDAAQPVALVAQPFMGLEAFEAKDAALFFGRHDETRALVDRLKAVNFVMVVGDSGAGKSSLVKAGLIPAFREGVLADPRGKRPDPAQWHVVEMRPGSNPFESLVEGAQAAATAARIANGMVFELGKAIRTREPGSIRDALRLSGPAGASLLLVVDQFEELWTLTSDNRSRRDFLDALLALAPPGETTRRVVGTMRRDYYHLHTDDDALKERLATGGNAGRFLLAQMSEAGLREAVVKPLLLAGEQESRATALADEVVKDVAGQPGNLALVEMALHQTWEKRGASDGDLTLAYQRLDRLEGALAKAAEEVFWNAADDPRKLTAAERPLAEALFMRLVRAGDAGGATRRPVAFTELAEPARAVARKLATKECSRLLVVREPTAGPGQAPVTENAFTVELAHEQLMTQWPDYRFWLRGTGTSHHRADLSRASDKRALDRLMDAARSWSERGGKDEDLQGGGELTEFERLAQARADWLSKSEREFVARCIEAREQGERERQEQLRTAQQLAETRKRQVWWTRIAAVVLLIATGGAGWQWLEAQAQAQRAEKNAEEAKRQTGRLLSTEAQRRLAQPITQDTSPLIAALAATGWRLGKSSEAWNAMQRVPLVTTLARVTHDSEVLAVAFSPDGQFLATASRDRTARLVAVADGRERARVTHDSAVYAVAFSPDGQFLATASGDNMARLVAVADGRERARVTHDSEVLAVAFSPDGQSLATASRDGIGRGEARLVAVADGRERARVTHDSEVYAVAFSPDGQFLATASADNTARLVAVADGRERARVTHEDTVLAVAFSPDGQFLATASADNTARLVAVADGRERARVTHDNWVRAVAFSPDGQFLATASRDGTARLVAVADGRERARVTHDNWVRAVAFSPNGQFLATASGGGIGRGEARLVAVADGRERARVTHDGEVYAVAFSPDGQFLATASRDGTARLVAVADGRERARVTHDSEVYAVAFSPDGQFLATASRDGTARLVAVADGRERARVTHDGGVYAVAFSPDGQFLATASWDGTARLVAVADGRERARVTHEDTVLAVAFSPDGQSLATASADKTARLWSTTLDDMLHQLCTGHGRNLSLGEWRRYLGDLPWQPTCENWPTPKD